MSKPFAECPQCGRSIWTPIPDSLAEHCACGYVRVRTDDGGWEAGASLQEWARDTAKAMNLVKCYNCAGHGVISSWNDDHSAIRRDQCAWCLGKLMIDKTLWIKFQPHRQHPRMFMDIRLEGGSEVMCCWPGSQAWKPPGQKPKDLASTGPLTADRITHVRVSVPQPF